MYILKVIRNNVPKITVNNFNKYTEVCRKFKSNDVEMSEYNYNIIISEAVYCLFVNINRVSYKKITTTFI